jgi:hypothetical protein
MPTITVHRIGFADEGIFTPYGEPPIHFRGHVLDYRLNIDGELH